MLEDREVNKTLCFSNSEGEAELWLQFIDTEGAIKWWSPLRQIWANEFTIDKLERRLDLQTKREKNMALIVKRSMKKLGFK